MTPEREQEFRLQAKCDEETGQSSIAIELLAEIDRLRAENKDFDEQRNKYFHAMQDLHKERDELKTENEKLKESGVLCPACGTDWQLQTIVNARMDICKENQRLRKRISEMANRVSEILYIVRINSFGIDRNWLQEVLYTPIFKTKDDAAEDVE